MREIDYQQAYKELLNQNIDILKKEIDTPEMEHKIEQYCQKFELPEKFVKRKILTDNIFANSFIKEPGRQSYNQTVALKFISENPLVENIVQLPVGGKKALYVVNGKITNEKIPSVKSIDFYWEVRKGDEKIFFYASHKYTKDEGGAQDNQYNDLLTFMKNAKESYTKNIFFLAIGDGDYYQRRDRINYMNSLYGTEHCRALTSNDIDTFIDTVLSSF